MTPGFAKSRKELFYLPYPEADQVIINAHNFTPAETFAVNGKTPIGVWCPSRDSAGNGTTTLTDRAGSNNGILTNMDAATDWVSDTGAGGIRALDFDGVNDQVIISAAGSINAAAGFLSFWLKPSAWSAGAFDGVFSMRNGGNSFELFKFGADLFFRYGFGDAQISFARPTAGAWAHIIVEWNSASGRSVYVDNSLAVTSSGTWTPMTVGGNFVLAQLDGAGNPFAGRLDDIRSFNVVSDSTDRSYLYNSGSGRGRVA